MSVVTDIILITFIEDGSGENEHLNVDLLNKYLLDHYRCELVKVDNYAGGNKCMQCDVFIGAINYLDIDNFINQINKISWEHPESLQFLLQKEEDEYFTAYKLETR